MAARRRSIVVCVGAESSREDTAHQIATLVAEEGADTVELWLAAGASGVLLLRELLRKLIDVGRRDVSIVLHRVR